MSKGTKSKTNSAKKGLCEKPSKAEPARIKEEHYFVVVDGSALKSLKELAEALDSMSDDVFYYHVTKEKNDFANWVRDVFNEAELAEKLFNAKTKEKHEIEILKQLLKIS